MNTRPLLCALLILPGAFVYACSGGDTTKNDAGGGDATTGDSGGKDASKDTGPIKDGAGSDTGTNDGSTDAGTDTGANDAGDAGSFGDGGPCFAASDCNGGYCCATVVFDGGVVPKCSLASATSICSGSCTSSVDTTATACTATDTVRLCSQPSDCTETNYNKCCNLGDASTFTFCWSLTYATIAGGSCM